MELASNFRLPAAGDLQKQRLGLVVGGTAAALLAGLLVGLGAGAGLGPALLLLTLLAPFGLMLVLARPHWASIVYLALVYTDLLSIMVRYHDFPALAPYAGVALVTAVIGYRLFVQREPLAHDMLTIWLLAYGAMVALGILYARSPGLVVENIVEFVRSFFTYIIIINTITNTRRLHTALYTILGAGVFLAALTLFQGLTGRYDQDFGGLAQYRVSDIAGTTEGARPGGTIGDANYYGQLLLVVVPIALYLVFSGRTLLPRLVGLASAAVLTIAVIFTYSRGDALALAAMAVAVVVFKRPNPLVLVGGLVALILALPLLPSNYLSRLTTVIDVAQGNRLTIYGEDSIRGRAGATQAAIEMFSDHPLFGVGRENYPLYQLEYISGTGFARVAKGIPPHNLYLEVAAEHGLLGILLFGGLLLTAWAALMDARRRFKSAGAAREHELSGWLAIIFVGYLITGLSLHGAFLYILWMIISLIAATRLIARSYTPTLASYAPVSAPPLQLSTPWAPQTRPVRPGRLLTMPGFSRRTEEVAVPGAASLYVTPTTTEPAPQTTRPSYVRRVNVAHLTGATDIRTWLAAGEDALQRGDTQVARAMVDLALERDPYNAQAWAIDLRIRLNNGDYFILPGYVVPTEHEQPQFPLDAKMFTFWRNNGGAPVFGYPISPRFYEVSTAGGMVEVQYMERARLEYYPAHAGTNAEIQTGYLSREIALEGVPGTELPDRLSGEQVLFWQNISAPRRFFDFWEANGGPNILGLPISPVLVQAGSALLVQYFEKACLQYHPQWEGTVHEVQIARLGTRVFAAKYGQKVER